MPPTNRGQHPDLDESGNLKPDIWLDPSERDFQRMSQSPDEWNAFMHHLAAWQSQLPDGVQRLVAGRTYAPEGSAYQGFREYMQTVDWARKAGHGEGEHTSAEVEKMSLDEYNAAFDERGQPREGHRYRPTARDVPIDSTLDPHSRRELRQGGQS